MMVTPWIPVDRKTLRVLVAAALLYADAHPKEAAPVIEALKPHLAVLVDDSSDLVC